MFLVCVLENSGNELYRTCSFYGDISIKEHLCQLKTELIVAAFIMHEIIPYEYCFGKIIELPGGLSWTSIPIFMLISMSFLFA